jgi:hypothetical protein
LRNSRLYLLSQYWVDLKQGAGDVPQKLPEAGYVLNYTKIGSSLVSGSLDAANFWRDGGLSAGRIDLYPKLLHSFGTDFVVSQQAAVRATAYSFYNEGNSKEDDVLRTAFQYDIVGHTRLYKRYGSFLHVLEPSAGYHFISTSDNDLPVFDVTDLYKKTSLIELSLLNRIITDGTEVATVRLTQGVDTYNGDRPFLPLKLELAMNKGVPIKLDTTYNSYTGSIDTLGSEISLSVFKTNLTFGQRYDRIEDVMFFTAGLDFSPFKRVHFTGSIWYDAKGGGLRDLNITTSYQRQCWGLRLGMVKKPGDYSMRLMFYLTGISEEPSKDN